MKRLLLLWIALAGLMAAQQSKTIIIVRHAEKMSEAADAELSPAGLKRAQCLAETLKDAGVGAIYTSEVKRTQQTAEPLAKARSLQPNAIPARDEAKLVESVLKDTGQRVLIVGHSNLIPDIVKRLGAGEVPPMGATEYDRMILVMTTDGRAQPAVTLRYCDALPAAK